MNMKDIHKRIAEDYDRMVEEYKELKEKYPDPYTYIPGVGWVDKKRVKCHTQETS